MNKFLTIALLSSLAFFVVEGAIVYDPATNSYTNTTSGTKTTVTKTSTGSSSTASGSTTSGTKTTTTTSYTASWALSKLHTALENNQEDLLERLDGHYAKLAKTLGAASWAVDAPGRIDILECMGVLKSTSAPSGMDHVYQQLTEKISDVSTNLHSEIAVVEKKMKDKLLDEVTQKLEQAILEQKVASYLSEYTKVIDMFNTLFTDYTKEIEELVSELDEDEQDEFDTYTEKVAAYQKLMTTYDLFLKKVKASGLTLDPKTNALSADATPFYGYLRSQLLSSRWENVVAIYPKDVALKDMLQDATEALEKSHTTVIADEDTFLADLYPVDDMKLLSKSINSLRSEYLEKDGSFSCEEFVSNKAILVTSPELMTLMNKILNALQKDLSKALAEWATTHAKELVTDHKAKLTTSLQDKESKLLTRPALSKTDKELQAVRAFLQSAYRKGLDTNSTDKFFAKLTSVNTKIDKALTATKDAGVKKRLEMIKQAVEEFLDK